MQIHGLRRGLPRRLLLRGRSDAGHQPQQMHRLRRVRAECPAEAILPDTESGLEKWLELNTSFSAEWPNIPRKKDSPADADEHKGEEGKYDKYFTPDAGAGD